MEKQYYTQMEAARKGIITQVRLAGNRPFVCGVHESVLLLRVIAFVNL